MRYVRPQSPAKLRINARNSIKDALLFPIGNPGINIGSTGATASTTTQAKSAEGVSINSFATAWTYSGYSAVPITVIIDFRTLGAATLSRQSLWSSRSGSSGSSALYFRYDDAGHLELLRSQQAQLVSTSYTLPANGGVVAFTYDGTNYKIAAGGKILISGSSAQSCIFDQAMVGVEGGAQSLGGDISNAIFRSVFVAPRVMTDVELMQATANPYAFLEVSQPLFITSSGPQSLIITPSGGIVLSGTAAAIRSTIKSVSGGIQFAGTSVTTRGVIRTPTGGIALGGTATVTRGIVRAVSGGIAFAGSAAVTFFSAVQSRVITPVGGMVLGGSAAVVRTCTRLASGGISLAGNASVILTYIGATVGNWINVAKHRRRD